jgi:hypothetical protein
MDMLETKVMETKVIRLEIETKSIDLPMDDPVSWEQRQRERARRYAEYLRRREEEGEGDG